MEETPIIGQQQELERQKLELEARKYREEMTCLDNMPHVFRHLETTPGSQGTVLYAFYCQKCLTIKQRMKHLDRGGRKN